MQEKDLSQNRIKEDTILKILWLGTILVCLKREEVRTVFVMACVHIHRAIVYHRRRIRGTPSLYERVLCRSTDAKQ